MMRRLVVIAVLLARSLLAAGSHHPETPTVAPPLGAVSTVRDSCANFWTLVPLDDGRRRLFVLPAQAPQAWIAAAIPGVDVAAWTSLRTESDDRITIDGTCGPLRFDPRAPEKTAEKITAPLDTAPEGAWRAVARMPGSNHDISAAVLGGQFYVAGGATEEWGFPRRARVVDE